MSDTRAPGWIWANMPHITAAAALCVIVAGVFTWMFGGFQPKSQIDLRDALERLTKLETAQASTGQTAISDRTATTTAIEATKELFRTELKAWPLPREQSAQASGFDSHLSKLDGRADASEHRISDAEYNIRDLTNKYGTLTTSAPRK
jgi:hypothetical protein